MVEVGTVRRAVWFYNLELALLADGSYHLSVSATTVDEDEPQLLCQELLDERGELARRSTRESLKQVLTVSA